LSEAEKQFILDNIQTDVRKLLLNPPKDFKDNIFFLVEQIQSRQKAKGKLPSWYANMEAILPPPLSLEQCSSEATAHYKAGLLSGNVLVDLTGGMGIDSMAFADRFDQVIYIEQNPTLCERMEHNAGVFKKRVTVINSTAEAYLSITSFDQSITFFIDPARRDENAKKVFRFEDCSPRIGDLIDKFRALKAKVIVKAAPLIDLKAGIQELSNVFSIHVVSLKNDCKEVLFLLDFGKPFEEPLNIVTANLGGAKPELFHFSMKEEVEATPSYSDALRYLLIPNSSILKAGAFKRIAIQYNIFKISTNTHVYTSAEFVPDFPGRQFEIINASIPKGLGKADVISRNHPLTPPQILKKYKLKEGGDHCILAFRDRHEKPQMLLTRKI
jgi:hypothetical protein